MCIGDEHVMSSEYTSHLLSEVDQFQRSSSHMELNWLTCRTYLVNQFKHTDKYSEDCLHEENVVPSI